MISELVVIVIPKLVDRWGEGKGGGEDGRGRGAATDIRFSSPIDCLIDDAFPHLAFIVMTIAFGYISGRLGFKVYLYIW